VKGTLGLREKLMRAEALLRYMEAPQQEMERCLKGLDFSSTRTQLLDRGQGFA
jgi:hypothetical protein